MEPFQYQPINFSQQLGQFGDSIRRGRQNSMNQAYQNLYDPNAWKATVTPGEGQPPGGYMNGLLSLGRMFGWGR